MVNGMEWEIDLERKRLVSTENPKLIRKLNRIEVKRIRKLIKKKNANEIIFKYFMLSPKEENDLLESLPMVFAAIAPPILICSPPGTEYKVELYFFKT